jgi:hypothetical protein
MVRQPVNQLTYLRALRTIPGLSIHYGQFRSHVVSMPLASLQPGGPRFADVIRTDEKGSDVNLATLLLCDAYENDFEMDAIVSSDSDLAMPIQVVQKRGLKVVVLHPPNRHGAELARTAGEYRPIRPRALKACQFPNTLTDAHGTIVKPSTW